MFVVVRERDWLLTFEDVPLTVTVSDLVGDAAPKVDDADFDASSCVRDEVAEADAAEYEVVKVVDAFLLVEGVTVLDRV